MGRSRSTPGLVESRGRVSLEEMQVATRDPSASAAYLLTDEVQQKVTEVSVPGCGIHTVSRANRRKSSSGETDTKPLSEHGFTRPAPPIIYIPQSPETASAFPFPVNVSKDERRTPEGLSQAKFLTLRPSSPYFSHSPVSNTYDVSPVTDYSALSLNSSDQVFFGGPVSHLNHLSVPSLIPIGSGSVSPVSVCTPREYQQESLLAEIKRLRERLVILEDENASISTKLNKQQWEVENRLAEIELQICGTRGGASSASNSVVDDSERNRESVI